MTYEIEGDSIPKVGEDYAKTFTVRFEDFSSTRKVANLK
jgi:hypothetical protein